MATNVSPNNNYGEYVITGEVDVASGTTGPTAVRGDNMTVARGGVGTITVTLKGAQNVRINELLQRNVNFCGSTAPTTALGCRVHSVVQTTGTGGAGNDDIVITLKTTATAGGSGADTDGGSAVTLSFYVSFRFMKMGAWL
jgi:hypothetical protein